MLRILRRRPKRRVAICRSCGEINPPDAQLCTGCESPNLETMTTTAATESIGTAVMETVTEKLAKINEVAA